MKKKYYTSPRLTYIYSEPTFLLSDSVPGEGEYDLPEGGGGSTVVDDDTPAGAKGFGYGFSDDY